MHDYQLDIGMYLYICIIMYTNLKHGKTFDGSPFFSREYMDRSLPSPIAMDQVVMHVGHHEPCDGLVVDEALIQDGAPQ